GQGAKRAAGSHAGTPGHHRRRDLPPAQPLPGAGDSKSSGTGGHLSPARSANRPLHDESNGELPQPRRGARHSGRDGHLRPSAQHPARRLRAANHQRPPRRELPVRGRQDPQLHRRPGARHASAPFLLAEPQRLHSNWRIPARYHQPHPGRARHRIFERPALRDPPGRQDHRPGCVASPRRRDLRSGSGKHHARRRDSQDSRRAAGALNMPEDSSKSTKTIMSGMRQLEIRTRRMVNDSLAGEYHSVFKGRGMDFDEVREYTPGDEVRTIDWNVTARAGRPFVKKFTEERELTILLLVDISASGNFGSSRLSKRDLAAELASVLAFSAIRNSDKVGLLMYTDRVERYLPPKKGRRHVLRVVRDILYHTPEGRGTDSVKALDVVNHVLHRRAIVFLISDFQAPGDPVRARLELRRAMRQTNRRHDLIAVQIEDPRERELPNVGVLALEDAETGEIVELDTASAAVRKRFNELSVARARRLVNDFRAEGVDTLELKTDAPYMAPLQRFFKTRERRRV